MSGELPRTRYARSVPFAQAQLKFNRAMVLHHFVASALAGFRADAERKMARKKSKIDVTAKGKFAAEADPWVRTGLGS